MHCIQGAKGLECLPIRTSMAFATAVPEVIRGLDCAAGDAGLECRPILGVAPARQGVHGIACLGEAASLTCAPVQGFNKELVGLSCNRELACRPVAESVRELEA